MQIEELKVVITGAASGLGLHFVDRLLKDGASISAWDVNQEGLHRLKSAYPDAPLHIARVNVAREDEVQSAMKEAWDHFGVINGLVNNAGIFRDSLLVKKDRKSGEIKVMSLNQWQTVLDVDLTGPFLCTRELSAHVVEAGLNEPTVVINISSISRAGNMGQSNYSAAKAALIADTVTWAKELARYKIRVAAIAPGFVETPILEGMRPEMIDKMVAEVPLRRLGTPGEIYAGLRFILECDYFTGRCLDIDGGLRL